MKSDQDIQIATVEYLRQRDRDCWTCWSDIYSYCNPGMEPDKFVEILLTACDDGDGNVQILICDDDFTLGGPRFRLLWQWWTYFNKLAGDL